jgi:hypothetical protein
VKFVLSIQHKEHQKIRLQNVLSCQDEPLKIKHLKIKKLMQADAV